MKNKFIATKREEVTLRFSIEFDGKPEGDVTIVMYAFDRAGRLLAETPLKEGVAELPLDAAQARRARIFFAPAPEKQAAPVTLADMERLNAYEPVWKFDPAAEIHELMPIPSDLWKRWFKCKCRVRGRIIKPVIINDVTVDKPVCDARVHICEVDPWIIWIRRLPDPLVFRLRDELLRVIEQPIISVPSESSASTSLMTNLSSRWMLRYGDIVEINPQPEPPGISSQGSSKLETSTSALSVRLTELPLETRLALTSPSVQIVKESLLANVKLLLPRLCWFPWLLPFLHYDEIKVVQTDDQGCFDTTILYSYLGDKPDLYFWVEYLIEGVWQSVYKPNLRCNTWWNYPCGTEVTIRITDPRVLPGEQITPLPGRDVVLVGIGSNVTLAQIQRSTPNAAKEGLTADQRPFASTLELRMDMGWESLRTLGVTHYRWSYRRVTEGNGTTAVTDTPHLMTREVYRHYKVYVPDPVTVWRPDYPAELMGPDPAFPGQGLIKLMYEDPGRDWHTINEHVDMAYAYFETGSLSSGKYELTFELVKVAGSSVTQVNWTNPFGSGTPINAFVAGNPAPFLGLGTSPASDEYLIRNGSGDVVGIRFVIHVDNSSCQANIYEVQVGDQSAGPCGFIDYADKNISKAHVQFIAHHPYQFATFNFAIVKGSSGVIDAVSFANAPVGVASKGYNNNPATGLFDRLVPVKDLLDANSHICTAAAFSETLYVYATAIDGYQRAFWLDSYATPKAFALSPAPKPVLPVGS